MSIRMRYSALFLVFVASFVACGGDSTSDEQPSASPTESMTDGSTARDSGNETPSQQPVRPSDAAPPADAGPGDADLPDVIPPKRCNTLANVAEEVTVMAIAEDPPPATGGRIADGVYVATSVTDYTGSGGASGPTRRRERLTAQVAGARIENVIAENETRSSTFTSDGNRLRILTTCPTTRTEEVLFSASETAFSVRVIQGGTTRVFDFEKR